MDFPGLDAERRRLPERGVKGQRDEPRIDSGPGTVRAKG